MMVTNAGVHEAVLLGEILAEGQLDGDLGRRHPGEGGTDGSPTC